MALKKSQLYSSLWSSCDELRGGMDASQYKDYVLTLLFVKYVSDKYAGDPHAVIQVPHGGSFDDLVALKGSPDIGDGINKVVARLAEANDLQHVIDQADFNDTSKLGGPKEMRDRLTKLVGIFQGLSFGSNRAEGDDLLGDAYEYLMRHFATQSGKSKGQFYTPAEVSRIMAKIIGVGPDTQRSDTVYDPTCGSGSLLLKVAAEAPNGISVYGQERDNATWALARMNLILHEQPTAELEQGNTLTSPHFTGSEGGLKTFDFAVANPPFSDKSWSRGLDPAHDEFRRFEYGIPPARNGDYAFLLHFIASLKSTGAGAIILPHGVLFRGNREANIRQALVRQGLIKGIIGLPPNLFYGTGIPACIVVIDKGEAGTRRSEGTGIFMVDASRGFRKDGNKNRLRERDIHKIVDVFNTQRRLEGYSRLVPLHEIANEENGYNLNLSRYIDSSEPEDIHDLDAHMRGGIPDRDLDDLKTYWEVLPSLRDEIFRPAERPGYCLPRLDGDEVRHTILEHQEFDAFSQQCISTFEAWGEQWEPVLQSLEPGFSPKDVAGLLSEDLLRRFEEVPLLDGYEVYQRFMDYVSDTMQDDLYVLSTEGWAAGRTIRPAEDGEEPDLILKKGRKTHKYVATLLPPDLIAARFFPDEQARLRDLEQEVDVLADQRAALEEEHTTEGGALDGLEGQNGVTKGNAQERVDELKEAILAAFGQDSPEHQQAQQIYKTSFASKPWDKGVKDEEGWFAELDVLHDFLRLYEEGAGRRRVHRTARATFQQKVISKYASLSVSEIKDLVVRAKWLAAMEEATREEVRQRALVLAKRISVLVERYGDPLPRIQEHVAALSQEVAGHLKAMGVGWE